MKESILFFDAQIFSSDALLSTGYWCADIAVMELEHASDGKWRVVLKARKGELTQALVDDFQTMLVHNQIRQNLRQAFSQMETAIVERAFRPVSSLQS